MARYSGNILRLKASQDPKIAPGEPDSSHDQPSGPEGVPEFRAQEISVPGDLGTEYAGLTLEDGIPRAIVAGQPSLGWNAPEQASTPVGSGGTPAGIAPRWSQADPHNAAVDTSFAGSARGAIAGSPYSGSITGAHSAGDDSLPYRLANQIGVAGTSFLERLADFPRQIWAEPTGAGADKFVAGTNSYGSSNPEGDQYAEGRGGARAHYGFETQYFVHTPMFQDKPAQTYDRRTAPVTARDPLVGGGYTSTPAMGQLAANTWLTELGESVTPVGYGVPVDGAI
ncbi:hypothetical protein [Streptomyces luteogriseus]|uniref:hypothetical protein n=1 Tax=Streptomyces luteogriseus TaxID=68233 RepID=UPI002629F98F|nr:hypothetical protein [uncultured Streptomyces sp.]